MVTSDGRNSASFWHGRKMAGLEDTKEPGKTVPRNRETKGSRKEGRTSRSR